MALDKFDIGSTFEKTITVTDADGVLIPHASISLLEAIVYVNNVTDNRSKFTSSAEPAAGWVAITPEGDDGTFTLTIDGAYTKDWAAGLIEVAIKRVLIDDGGTETERITVAMAQRVSADFTA